MGGNSSEIRAQGEEHESRDGRLMMRLVLGRSTPPPRGPNSCADPARRSGCVAALFTRHRVFGLGRF